MVWSMRVSSALLGQPNTSTASGGSESAQPTLRRFRVTPKFDGIRRFFVASCLSAVVAMVVVATAACSGDDGKGDGEPTPQTSPIGLTEFEFDWPLPNYDHSNTRATFDSTIDTGNVNRLTEAWVYELPQGKGFGAAATTPIVIDGTVYIGDLLTNVHAVDLATGERRWMAKVGVAVFGPSGVAVGSGKIFANKGGKEIAAYDAENGDEIWSTNLVGNGGAINIQPTIADGKVLVATSSMAQRGARGTLFALDQNTGDVLWSFDTIESDDLWGHPEINSGGETWYPPSVDTANHVSYWGTSNPYPFPGADGFPNGESRPGDNKWTDSILAVDLDNGELRWGHQAVAHDLFDHDTILTAVVDLEGDARSQVIISTGKLGRVIGLDPNGNVLWDTPIGTHKNDDLDSFEGELTVLPGAAGGVVTPIAVADGVVYLPMVNAPITYAGPEQSSSGEKTELGSINSQLVAIDAATGDILWDVELPGDSFGGATVVNDLVFTSVLTGLIIAFDRETGERVLAFQAPGGINGWPAVVDDRLVIPIGFGEPPVLLSLALGDGE